MEIRESRILLLSHISDLSGPTEALESFLVKRKVSILCSIYNPLEYCRINKRIVKLYNNGRLIREIYPTNFKFGRIFTWFLDYLITLYYSLRSKNKCELVICCDGLNALVGLLLKKVGQVESVIFYSIDWTPIRFKNRMLNIIYQKVNNYSLKRSDKIWCVSKRLADLQISRDILPEKIQYVPVGVKDVYSEVTNKDIEYKTLVFLGALEKTKGIEIVIETWKYLVEKDKQFKLVLIGKTPGNSRHYENILEKLPNVEVLGVLPHNEVLRILPKYGIGLAPYTFDNSSVSFYGDPSRIKDYLACGLPVIVTRVPEIADDIDKNNAGKIVDPSIQGLIDGIITLTKDRDNYFFFRNNAYNLAKRYNWDNIFMEAFSKI